MNDLVFEILMGLIPIILTVATFYGKRYISTLREKENLANMIVLAQISVKAVEQLWNGVDSKTKKEKAIDYLQKMGVDLTALQMEMLIEAAVKQLKTDGVIK